MSDVSPLLMYTSPLTSLCTHVFIVPCFILRHTLSDPSSCFGLRLLWSSGWYITPFLLSKWVHVVRLLFHHLWLCSYITITSHLTTIYSSTSTRYMWSSMGQSFSLKSQVPSVTDLSSLFIYACFLLCHAHYCYFMPNIYAMSGICLCLCMGQSMCFCSFWLLWGLFSWVLWASTTLITGPEHIPVISPFTLFLSWFSLLKNIIDWSFT